MVGIGVDVGGTGTKAGIVDARGEILSRTHVPTDPTAGTKGIIAVVEELLERAGPEGWTVSSVGIGAAGFIDSEHGSVTFSPNLVYDDPQVAAAVRARTELPVVVDNDANAAVWGEYRYGTARGCKHVAMITIGTGIGSGFIIDGRLLRGATGAAAEFGHTVVEIDGPACPCGLRGCLEPLASGTGIARMGSEAAVEDPHSSIHAFSGQGGPVTAEHVAKAARQMDETAKKVLRRAGRALGVGLSNLVNAFDPEVIVLGGGVIRAGEPFLGCARDQLNEMMQQQRRRPVRLDVTKLGDDAGIVGAAALGLEPLDSWEGQHHGDD